MDSVPVSFITVHICHFTTRDVPVEHTRNCGVLNKQSINQFKWENAAADAGGSRGSEDH